MELDMSGYDRGDSATRWQGYKTAVEAGILTPNEIREIEGWNPAQPADNLLSALSNE